MAEDSRVLSDPKLWVLNGRPYFIMELNAPAAPTSPSPVARAPPSLRPPSSEKEPCRTTGAGRSADPPRLSDVSVPDSAVYPTASCSSDLEAMVDDTTAGNGRGRPWPWKPRRHTTGGGGGGGGWLARYPSRHRHHNHHHHHHHHHSSCRSLGVTAEVWPSQRHWKMKAKEQKMQRSCTGLSRLSKRKRMAVKILIGLLVVGVAVGVGLGISKALGAPMWSPHDYRNNS